MSRFYGCHCRGASILTCGVHETHLRHGMDNDRSVCLDDASTASWAWTPQRCTATLVVMEEQTNIPLPRSWPNFVKRALLCAIGLERLALLEVRSGFEHSPDPRARTVAELDACREENAILHELVRILHSRWAPVPPSERPHYSPCERMAILKLQSRAKWNLAKMARAVQLTRNTLARWQRRLDAHGSDELLELRAPVNKFDDAVTELVQDLHQVAPNKGRRKLAEFLMRAGLHLSASTVRRMTKRKPVKTPPPELPPEPTPPAAQAQEPPEEPKPRTVTAKRPHHVWHIDISAIPVGLPGSGYWVAWWPFSIILTWLCSWHFVLVLDHFTRALVAFNVTRREPSASDVCATLDQAVLHAGVAPKHIISDKGTQFRSHYRAWCNKHRVKHRYGAVGQHGSIAVIERFILSLKQEFLRRIAIPAKHESMLMAMSAYQCWYNTERPHSALDGRTPNEMARGDKPPRLREHFEPRSRYPISDSDETSGPEARPPPQRPRGKLELVVSYVDGHRELPIVQLRDAA